MLITAAKKLLGDNMSFLPDRTPESRIPEEFANYEAACFDIPSHYPVDKGGVRDWLDEEFRNFDPTLPARLADLNMAQLRYLNVLLVILSHCYRWESSPPPPDAAQLIHLSLPRGITELWQAVRSFTDQKQVGSNATMFNWNWRLEGKEPDSPYSLDELSIERLHTIHYWLTEEHELVLDRWVGIFVIIEATGATALRALMKATDMAEIGDQNVVR